MSVADKTVADYVGLAGLRKPFPHHQISKLPKPTKAQNEAVKANYKAGARCGVCSGWHHPDAVHLDYVGHAALTDRLLDVDPQYICEPMAHGPDGLPAFDRNGGLWVRLTVLGVTRMGYGDADGKQGGNAIKEAIGDAMRNAAMRFGAALDLWHKGDLHLDGDGADNDFSTARDYAAQTPPAKRGLDGPLTSKASLYKAFQALQADVIRCGDDDTLTCLLQSDDALAVTAQCERDAPHYLHGGGECPPEFVGLLDRISQMRREFMIDANEGEPAIS